MSGLVAAPADARLRSLPARSRANHSSSGHPAARQLDCLLGSKRTRQGPWLGWSTGRQLRTNSQPSGMNDGGYIGHSIGRPH